MKKIYLLSFVLIFGATAVSHDIFCHEHLHEISSPLHSLFDAPEFIEAAGIIGNSPPQIALSVRNEKLVFSDYIKNIFHPPDPLS